MIRKYDQDKFDYHIGKISYTLKKYGLTIKEIVVVDEKDRESTLKLLNG